jgi:hypothetical protein
MAVNTNRIYTNRRYTYDILSVILFKLSDRGIDQGLGVPTLDLELSSAFQNSSRKKDVLDDRNHPVFFYHLRETLRLFDLLRNGCSIIEEVNLSV